MADVQGIVQADSPIKVRPGPRITDPSTGTPLAPGTAVTITGFAIDPRGDSYRHRYCITLNGQPRWVTAAYIKVDPTDALQIPYIFQFPNDLVRELREGLGITALTASTTEADDIQAIARYMPNFYLRGNNWDAPQITKLRGWLEQLYAYGVILNSPGPGGWALSEIESAFTAVSTIAQGMSGFLHFAFGLDDPALAFRLLYAPLIITRANRDNVNTMSDSVWFAKNVQGYEVVFGNRVFFPGKSPTKRYPQLPFTTVELIAHEVSHVINFRYQLTNNAGQDMSPDDFYMATINNAAYTFPNGTAIHLAGNAGFGFVARSSDDPAEIVTDAIANAALGRMTFGSTIPAQSDMGTARQAQLTDLIKRVMQWQVKHYVDLNTIKTRIDAIRVRNPQLADMTPALNAVAVGDASLDKQMAMLKGISPLA
jgi:hypothetical protein